jgi:capsular exopolysaccharide synthesis family protein
MSRPFDPARQSDTVVPHTRRAAADFDNGGSRDKRERDLATPFFEEVADVVPGEMHHVTATVLAPDSPVSEEFRILRTRVRRIDEERPFRCIGVVSSASGEGKTTISLGLAVAMARESGCRVLLIEADVRRPTINDRLSLPNAPGLSDWLQSQDDSVPVRVVTPYKFSLLSAGHAVLEHAEQLASARMSRLVEAARQFFDFVVVDCPPLIPVADSALLQDLVDGFLLVVRARHTPSETIRRALSRLRADKIQGLVFNGQREILRSTYGPTYKPYSQ